MPGRSRGFFIAPFGIDGEPEGIGYWDMEKLSRKWIAMCEQKLNVHDPAFHIVWSGSLSHISTTVTSVSGVAIVTYSVHGKPAASVLLASGHSEVAEANVAKMFIHSLRNTALVKEAATSSDPFQKIIAIEERPMMAVVPWPDASIARQDHILVQELSLHVAGAFFRHVGPRSY